jgi:hypothetical protein
MSRRREQGSALVEAVFFIALAVVPLILAIAGYATVARASDAATLAARAAGRAFVTSPPGANPLIRARDAAAASYADAGLGFAAPEMSIACSATPCLTPGGIVRISVGVRVTLSRLPFGRGVTVPVTGSAVDQVDRFRALA